MFYGALAQLIERGIRIAEVTSLNLVCSTRYVLLELKAKREDSELAAPLRGASPVGRSSCMFWMKAVRLCPAGASVSVVSSLQGVSAST